MQQGTRNTTSFGRLPRHPCKHRFRGPASWGGDAPILAGARMGTIPREHSRSDWSERTDRFGKPPQGRSLLCSGPDRFSSTVSSDDLSRILVVARSRRLPRRPRRSIFAGRSSGVKKKWTLRLGIGGERVPQRPHAMNRNWRAVSHDLATRMARQQDPTPCCRDARSLISIACNARRGRTQSRRAASKRHGIPARMVDQRPFMYVCVIHCMPIPPHFAGLSNHRSSSHPITAG